MFTKRLSILNKVLVAAIGAAVFAYGPVVETGNYLLKRLENRSIDYRFLLRGPKPTTRKLPVVIVMIDNESALEYGYRSPTPRNLLADVALELYKKEAAVIGIDVLLDRSYNEEEDKNLEAAFQKTGDRVVLVKELILEEDHENVIQILPRFSKHTHEGYSISKSEGDDFHRWVNIYKYPGQVPFAVRIYELYSGKTIDVSQYGVSRKHPWILLNFPGYPSRLTSEHPNFDVVSALELPYIPKALFKDKIVLIGSAIEDLGDTFLTPFSTQKNSYMQMFGVELHAITLSMLFQDNFYNEADGIFRFAFLFLFFFVSCILFLFLRPLWGLFGLPICMVLWAVLSVYVFIAHKQIFPIIYPVTAIVIIFIFCQWLIHLTEMRRSRFLKNTFQHYISPELVEQLAETQEEVSLGGRKEDLTIFFSDLQGFTTASEKLTAEGLMQFLHIYFEEMTNILLGEKGTLDKYIGDAIMAFFGAPTPLTDHAERACRASLLMQKRIKELNASPEGGWIPANVRIGINTGEVIVGNSGSQTRFNYTVIGDGVNLASRLEGVNKLFGSKILVSESTFRRIPDSRDSGHPPFYFRELGRFVVKGKAKPVAVYELMEFKHNVNEEMEALKNAYEEALGFFYEKKFEDAKLLFEEIRDRHKDKASGFLLEQITYLMKNPPSQEWKGEIILLTK